MPRGHMLVNGTIDLMRGLRLLWGVLLVSACTRPANTSMCVTGDQKACACLGGTTGVQVCLADGSYDACQCPGNDQGVPGEPDLAIGGSGSDDLAAGGDDGGLGSSDLAGTSASDLAGSSAADLAGSTASDLAGPTTADFAGLDLAGSGTGDLGMVGNPNPDLATVAVVCGASSCSASQLCCLSNTATNGSCVAAAPGACDGGSPFVCDGPEDCAGQGCCVDVTTVGDTASGRSTCGASCAGSYTFGTGSTHAQSKLCHADSDCNGFSGSTFLGTLSFDKCCHSTATSPYRVCVPGSLAGAAGYTCP
jgi:hypothetical protein